MMLSRAIQRSPKSLVVLRDKGFIFGSRKCIHSHSDQVGTISRGTNRQNTFGPCLRPPRRSNAKAYSTLATLPQVSTHSRHATIYWNPEILSSSQSNFHYIWLRDHCRCSECFHEITKQRLVDTFSISANIKPSRITTEGDGLKVSWSPSGDGEGHTSIYPWEWLQRNSYDPPSKSITERGISLWDSSIASRVPIVAFNDVMKEESAVYRWLHNIDRFGFCFVSGVPATLEDTETLSRRIAFIRETQYGGFWDFSSDLAHGDTAYTSIALGAHTDNTYYTDPCGLQLFHLIQPAPEGGHTLLVDGFRVAEIMRERHSDLFEILTSVPVPSHAAGNEDSFYFTEKGRPVIELKSNGEIQSIRWNNDDRSVMASFGGESVLKWYEAVRVWNKLLTSKEHEFWIPLKAGTAVVIDNHRVLHGRSAFSGPRRMCGAYIGADEYHSRLRVLQERYARTSADRSRGERSVWSPGL